MSVHDRPTAVVGTLPEAVPATILRSAAADVDAFLRDVFGVPVGLLKGSVSGSERFTRETQLLLLDRGILSERSTRHASGEEWELRILEAPDERRAEIWDDEVVGLERGRADVYDISVEGTHRYAAAGFVNHNSFWHAKIMTERALGDAELIDYAERHSGTMAMQPGSLNPYKVGLELFRDIEDRWNRGAHGAEYEECSDIQKRARWNLGKGEGMAKIFEVRRVHNDVTFIDSFLTDEFCRKHRFFTYAYDEEDKTARIKSREFEEIKEQFLFALTNFGQPFIYVEDANFRNRGELLLTHRHEGVDLKLDWTRETLSRVALMWRRPVHLLTRVRDHVKLLGHDGESWTEEDLGKDEAGEETE